MCVFCVSVRGFLCGLHCGVQVPNNGPNNISGKHFIDETVTSKAISPAYHCTVHEGAVTESVWWTAWSIQEL